MNRTRKKQLMQRRLSQFTRETLQGLAEAKAGQLSRYIFSTEDRAWLDMHPVGRGAAASRPFIALQANRAAIRSIVEAHRAHNARVFGSVLHGDDTDDSDLDLLIEPTPDTTLMDVATIQVELETLLGVRVDVHTPNSLPEKFRHLVLAEAVPV